MSDAWLQDLLLCSLVSPLITIFFAGCVGGFVWFGGGGNAGCTPGCTPFPAGTADRTLAWLSGPCGYWVRGWVRLAASVDEFALRYFCKRDLRKTAQRCFATWVPLGRDNGFTGGRRGFDMTKKIQSLHWDHKDISMWMKLMSSARASMAFFPQQGRWFRCPGTVDPK